MAHSVLYSRLFYDRYHLLRAGNSGCQTHRMAREYRSGSVRAHACASAAWVYLSLSPLCRSDLIDIIFSELAIAVVRRIGWQENIGQALSGLMLVPALLGFTYLFRRFVDPI